MRIHAEYRPWMETIGIFLEEPASDGRVAIKQLGEPLEVSMYEITDAAKATFQLRMDEAQELMDKLWKCGLRPTEGKGSAGALKATEYHLEDMRKMTTELLTMVKNPC